MVLQYTDDVTLGDAVRDTLLPSALVPVTTLTLDAASGDTALTPTALTGGTRARVLFQPGSPVTFHDGLGEGSGLTEEGEDLEPVTIALDWDGETLPIPLNFNGTGQTALVNTHVAGTTISTNLYDFTPDTIDFMLVGGWPVIWVTVEAEGQSQGGTNWNKPQFTVRVDARLPLSLPRVSASTPQLDTNLWYRRTQRRGRRLLRLIGDAILTNWHLTTMGTPKAVGLGVWDQPLSTLWSQQWGQFVSANNTVQFTASGTFPVLGQPYYYD